jgi:hypothetical protein
VLFRVPFERALPAARPGSAAKIPIPSGLRDATYSGRAVLELGIFDSGGIFWEFFLF